LFEKTFYFSAKIKKEKTLKNQFILNLITIKNKLIKIMQKLYQSNRGLLILIGGAEDKKDEKVILKRILAETQAKKVIIIPTASSYPRDVFNNYKDAFSSLNVKSIINFDIRRNDETEREEYYKHLEDADLIFFAGGDQTVLVPAFLNTNLLAKILEKFNNGTLHIAGTSAGAAAASNPMLYDGDNKGFFKGTVFLAEGFGLIDEVTVDTHFLQRERIARLSQILVSGRSSKGIGLDEDTAIIIYPDDKFEVVGSGMVTLLNSVNLTGSNYDYISDDDILNYNNLRIGFLSGGAKFNLTKWSIIKTAPQKKTIDELFESIVYNS